MRTFKVAHIREQGQNIIIVPLQREPTDDEYVQLQDCATSAGLAGTVVPVWDRFGRVAFLGPEPWHPFLRGLSWPLIRANLNKTLTCG